MKMYLFLLPVRFFGFLLLRKKIITAKVSTQTKAYTCICVTACDKKAKIIKKKICI